MSIDRKFNTFILGDDPTQLADQALLKVAGACSINLYEGLQAYDTLIDMLAPHMVNGRLQESTLGGGYAPINKTANDIRFWGIEDPFNRSLWSPNIKCPPEAPRIAIGGLAYVQDFVAEKCIKDFYVNQNGQGQLWLAVGARKMDSPAEAENEHVDHYRLFNGEYPTEKQYAEKYIASMARDNGYTDVRVEEYDTQDTQEIAEKFVAAHHEELFSGQKQLVFADISHAVVPLANQFRNEARKYNPDFDADPNDPQIFLKGHGRWVASNDFERTKPQKCQSPYESLHYLALTAKVLAEARVELQGGI